MMGSKDINFKAIWLILANCFPKKVIAIYYSIRKILQYLPSGHITDTEHYQLTMMKKKNWGKTHNPLFKRSSLLTPFNIFSHAYLLFALILLWTLSSHSLSIVLQDVSIFSYWPITTDPKILALCRTLCKYFFLICYLSFNYVDV